MAGVFCFPMSYRLKGKCKGYIVFSTMYGVKYLHKDGTLWGVASNRPTLFPNYKAAWNAVQRTLTRNRQEGHEVKANWTSVEGSYIVTAVYAPAFRSRGVSA